MILFHPQGLNLLIHKRLRYLRLLKFTIAEQGDKPMIELSYKGEKKQFAAEEISSVVLAKGREIVEADTKRNVACTIVVAPANLNDKRQAIKYCCYFAGVRVILLLNKPTAAAIAYGLNKNTGSSCGKNVLVFDLGGDTLNVSLLTIEDGIVQEKSTSGDIHLGGVDFDNRMLDYIVHELKKKHSIDISENLKAIKRLRTACERAKRILSSTKQTTIEIDSLFEGTDFYKTNITRARFEELNMDLFEKCIEPVEKCLRVSRLDRSSVHNVVLIGGSSRIPKIQQLLQDFFNGKELCKSMNTGKILAHVVKFSVDRKAEIENHLVLDVNRLSLGLETVGDLVTVLIPRNAATPIKKEQIFSTCSDNQSDVSIKVFEGERPRPDDSIIVAEFILSGIPPAPRGVPKINVALEIDEDGNLNVSVEHKTTGQKIIETKCKRACESFIEYVLEKGEVYKVEDEEHKKRAEAKNALENYVYNVRNMIMYDKIGSDIALMDKEIIEIVIQEAFHWLDEHTRAKMDEYADKLKELESICDSIILPLCIDKMVVMSVERCSMNEDDTSHGGQSQDGPDSEKAD